MNKFNKLYNVIMEDLRDDLKEGQEYEIENGKITPSKKNLNAIDPNDEDQDDDIDVDYYLVFDVLEEIVKGADPKALQRLHKRFEKYEVSDARQACCDIMEGDGWGVWTGLMDPENWKNMGFNLTPDQEKILTIYNRDVNNVAFYEFDDSEVEMTEDFMIKAGGQDIVESFEEY